MEEKSEKKLFRISKKKKRIQLCISNCEMLDKFVLRFWVYFVFLFYFFKNLFIYLFIVQILKNEQNYGSKISAAEVENSILGEFLKFYKKKMSFFS